MSAPEQVDDGTPRGRHVQVGLLFGAAATPPLRMDRVVAQELAIYGSHGRRRTTTPGCSTSFAAGAWNPQRRVGRVVGLEAAGAALAGMGEPGRPPGLTIVDVSTPEALSRAWTTAADRGSRRRGRWRRGR